MPYQTWLASLSLLFLCYRTVAPVWGADYRTAPDAMDYQQSWGQRAPQESSQTRSSTLLAAGSAPIKGERFRDAPNAATAPAGISKSPLTSYQSPKATTQLLVGIRAESGQPARQALEIPMGRLALSAGFNLKRVVGYRKLPGGGQLMVLVEGDIPVRNIKTMLADASVVFVSPASRTSASTEAAPQAPRRTFFEFVLMEHPAVLLLTVLALIYLLSAQRGRASTRSRR